MRGVSVETSRSARPSSRHSATAAGFCTSSESGPPSIDPAVEPLGADDAAGRGRGLERRAREAAPLQLVGGREPGDPAADDGDVDRHCVT